MERLVASADNALKTLLVTKPEPARANPANAKEANLADDQRRHAAALMRVNHAGEVAAQGLYQGHALVARTEQMQAHLQHAAEEEYDHLAWCDQRLKELDSRPSLLGPAWYAGAYAIGALSALAGDRWGLGFIEETEKQVAAHLDDHLNKLPSQDQRSRQILATMKAEEEAHGKDAHDAGAAELPAPIKGIMKVAASVMKAGAYRV